MTFKYLSAQKNMENCDEAKEIRNIFCCKSFLSVDLKKSKIFDAKKFEKYRKFYRYIIAYRRSLWRIAL